MNAMQRGSRWLTLAGLAVSAMLLTGCATSRNVDSEVRSFTGTTQIAAGATYRFERLPSQDPKVQEPLEATAQHALAAKGLVRADDKAHYSVQVRLDDDLLMSDSMSRWANSPFPDRIVLAPNGTLWRQVRHPQMDPRWYRRTVQVVIRDLANGSVAYDTRATNDSPWSDTVNLMAPLVEAALHDFPQSESQPKTITVVLTPPAAAAR